MADITMCSGVGCRVKDKCYRFTAARCEWGQSYFFKPPLEVKDEVLICDHFWGEKPKKEFTNVIEDILKDNK